MENFSSIVEFLKKYKVLIAIIASVVLLAIGSLIYYNSLLQTPISSSAYADKQYQEVEEAFVDAGFENIEMIPVHDLDSGNSENQTVESITISEDTDFSKGDRYSAKALVQIQYHDFSDKAIYSTDIAFGEDATETQNNLTTLGFSNVEVENEKLKSGSPEELGTQSILIDGEAAKIDYYYSQDSDVVVSETVLDENAIAVEKVSFSKSLYSQKM